MIFSCATKYNGKWYAPGEEIIEVNVAEVEKSTSVTKNIPTSTNVAVTETLESSAKHTKTEINRMSTSALKILAKEYGIDNSLSGTEIKKALINKLEL